LLSAPVGVPAGDTGLSGDGGNGAAPTGNAGVGRYSVLLGENGLDGLP
jgi:hypothetical protein